MKEWSVIVPGKPHLIHPVMAVIRDSDLHDACRILQAISHPSPSEEKCDIQAINSHIATILSSDVSVPSHLGQLKPVKVRFCVDASVLLNPFIKKWRFPYASIHDAVSLLQKGWFMARIDLKRFFQQLPLHEQDWPMLGLRLPKDLRHLTEEVETWVSAFAHFGGSPFPAYANGIMSALSGMTTYPIPRYAIYLQETCAHVSYIAVGHLLPRSPTSTQDTQRLYHRRCVCMWGH